MSTWESGDRLDKARPYPNGHVACERLCVPRTYSVYRMRTVCRARQADTGPSGRVVSFAVEVGGGGRSVPTTRTRVGVCRYACMGEPATVRDVLACAVLKLFGA